jgi:hypothetical protein
LSLLTSSLFAQSFQEYDLLSSSMKSKINRLFEITKTAENFEEQTTKSMNLLRNSNDLNLPNEFFDEVIIEFRKEMPKYLKKVAIIYASHYNESEITELIQFYSTPLGKKLLSKSSSVMEETQKFGYDFGREIGERVMKDIMARKEK